MYSNKFKILLLFAFFLSLFEQDIHAATLPDIRNHWARSEIQMLIDMGIVEGRTNASGKKMFYPEAKITRAEFVVMLVSAMGLKVSETPFSSYSDTIKHWAAPFIEAGTAANITGGVGDGLFLPDKPISRVEIAVMIVRAKKWKDQGNAKAFADVDSEYWAYNDLLVARHHGIAAGNENNRFNPFQNATRAETAAMIARMLYMN